MSNTPQTVRGKISPKGIAKADRFFSGSLKTALTELLQNSRRAGASQVTCNVRQVEIDNSKRNSHAAIIEFIDDGPGVKEPQILFDLLESGWDAKTQASEDPAGAGFFSLAGLSEKVEIASHNWRVTATRAVFCGESEAIVVPGDKPIKGLYLKFEVAGDAHTVGVGTIKETLAKLCEFGTLRVVFNGEELPRRDFLHDCFKIVERDGVRIGFCFVEHYHSARHNENQERPTRSFHYSHEARINFYGVQIFHNDIVPNAEGLSRLGCWQVGVVLDIKDTSAIKMTLPQRDAIVENAEWKALKDWLRIEVYRQGLAQFQGQHRLSFKTYSELKAAGLEINEAVPALRQWYAGSQAGSDYYSGTYPDDMNAKRVWLDSPQEKPVLLLPDVEDEMRGVLISTAGALFANAGGKYDPLQAADPTYELCDYTLLQASHKFEGYSWYDQLPQVRTAKFELHTGNKKHTLVFDITGGGIIAELSDKEPDQADDEHPGKHLKSIRVTLEIASNLLMTAIEKAGTKKPKPQVIGPFETLFLITSENAYDPGECGMWLSKDVDKLLETSVACKLIDILLLCGFSYSDDSEDSCDDQLEYATDTASKWVRGCLYGPLDNIRSTMRDVLDGAEFGYRFYRDWMQAGARQAVIKITLDPVPKANPDACVGVHVKLTDEAGKTLIDTLLVEPRATNKKTGNKKPRKVSS